MEATSISFISMMPLARTAAGLPPQPLVATSAAANPKTAKPHRGRRATPKWNGRIREMGTTLEVSDGEMKADG